MENKIKVEFMGGPMPDLDEDGEIINPEKYDAEDYAYLKAEILSQAEERGIPADRLEFWGE